MKTVVDHKLKLEVAEYSLRFACEHCVHFDETPGTCAEGYPNEPHRRASALSNETLEFCKSFELG